MRPAGRFLPFSIALATIAASAPAGAQRRAEAAVDSAPTLAPAVARSVDSLFARYDRSDAPGCAVGVIREGHLVYEKGYGTANLDYGVPLTPKSEVYLASVSKQFTAMAIALLAQDGRLSLDDRVRRYIPELPDYMDGVSIRQLVYHTSGVRDYFVLFSLAGRRLDDAYTAADVVDALRHQQSLNFPPGTHWAYSNSGYVLLAMVVQRASGQSLRDFAAQHIFAPLGMTHTFYRDDHRDPVRDRAVGYVPKQTPTGARGERITWLEGVPNFDLVGDGGVYSTIEDLARWEQNFLTGAVGGRALIDSLTTSGTLNDHTPVDYGFGLQLGHLRGLRRIGHGGAYGGYRTELARFPERQLSIAILCNTSQVVTSRLANRVAEVVLGDSLPEPPVRLASQDVRLPRLGVLISGEVLAGWVGMYREPRTGALRRVALDGDRLIFERGQGFELVPLSAREFQAKGTSTRVTFIAPADGTPARMTVESPDEDPVTYERLSGTPTPPESFGEYVGSYRNQDTGALFRVLLEKNALVLQLADGSRLTLAAGPDELFIAGDFAALRFERSRGRVVAFVLDADRAVGLRFERQ